MALEQFKLQLHTLPQSSIDFNWICSTGYAEYQALQILAGALLYPQTIVHTALSKAVSSVNSTTYKYIMQGLNDVNGTMKGILKTPVKDLKTISADIGNIGTALSHTCEFFLSTLPPYMFDIFQDLQYGIADIANGLFRLPDVVTNSIFQSLMNFKLQAMQSVMSALYSSVLAPILDYENFLNENGIPKILEQMRRMEICLMKPGICHRSASEFTEPTTRKPWSVYYRSQFLLTHNGRMNFNLMAGSPSQLRQLPIIHSNLMAFMSY